MNQTHYMRKAFKLAEKADFRVYPNPFVGALLVKNKKIISSGFHALWGYEHAEVAAINAAKKDAKGADLYVTLEPCSTIGKTPPCTSKIIESKIKNVFFGSFDPNPENHGKAKKILEKNGIKTHFLDFQKMNDDLNKVFIHNLKSDIPYVSLKAAISLDGMISDSSGKSKWISGELSRKKVHRMRRLCDCILIGGNTFNQDNPKLNVRLKKQIENNDPLCAILSGRGKLNVDNMLLKTTTHKTVYIITSTNGYKTLYGKIKNKNAEFITLPLLKGKKTISLLKALKALRKDGVHHVMVEGGGEVLGSFLREGIFNELNLFMAPKIFGGVSKSFSGQNPLFSVNHYSNLDCVENLNLENDIYLRYKHVYRNN